MALYINREFKLDEVTLVAVCLQPEHDKAKNLEKYDRFIKDAVAHDADFLAFPEMSLQGYFWIMENNPEQQKYYEHEAETIPGPSTDIIQKYCSEYNLYIQFGLAEKAEGKMYNTAVLLGPEGIVGSHRKVGCFEPGVSCGTSFSVYKTRIGKIGLSVCADFLYPESGRTLALQGAEVIANSTCSPFIGKDPKTDYRLIRYDICTKAQALFNQVWYMLANATGLSSLEKALGHKGGGIGHSRIINPMSNIVSEVGYEEGLAIATVDIKRGIYESRSPSGRKFIDFPLHYGINYIEKLGASPK